MGECVALSLKLLTLGVQVILPMHVPNRHIKGGHYKLTSENNSYDVWLVGHYWWVGSAVAKW